MTSSLAPGAGGGTSYIEMPGEGGLAVVGSGDATVAGVRGEDAGSGTIATGDAATMTGDDAGVPPATTNGGVAETSGGNAGVVVVGAGEVAA